MLANREMTVAEAADELGLTTGRVRQLCRRYNLGTMYETEIGTQYRLLSPKDIEFLRSRPDGRKKSA